MSYGTEWEQQMQQEIKSHLQRSKRVSEEFFKKLDKRASEEYPKAINAQDQWKIGSMMATIEWLLDNADDDMLSRIEKLDY